jgi:hypothetical protein
MTATVKASTLFPDFDKYKGKPFEPELCAGGPGSFRRRSRAGHRADIHKESGAVSSARLMHRRCLPRL